MSMHRHPRSRTFMAMMCLACSWFSQPVPADSGAELIVAISLDMPPYVMENASTGLEVDIVRRALAGHDVHFIQVPYGELQTAVERQRAAVSVGVQSIGDEVFYSDDFITFANYAISKKADGLKIDRVADLKGHRVLTWQGAYLELGDAFKRLFSPESPQHKNYLEVADQSEQVRMFWAGEGDVVVIDRSIFAHFSERMGHSMNEVTNVRVKHRPLGR